MFQAQECVYVYMLTRRDRSALPPSGVVLEVKTGLYRLLPLSRLRACFMRRGCRARMTVRDDRAHVVDACHNGRLDTRHSSPGVWLS